MLRGSAPARIDDKGRLKVPTDFRRLIEDRYGSELFVTSIRGDSALLYPLPVWEEIEQRLAALPSTDQAKVRYLERVNYFGQQVALDVQGRIVVPQILRERAAMNGDVVVTGQLNHLVVWNHERFLSRLESEPLSADDLSALAGAGI
jgi:MraZ protein